MKKTLRNCSHCCYSRYFKYYDFEREEYIPIIGYIWCVFREVSKPSLGCCRLFFSK